MKGLLIVLLDIVCVIGLTIAAYIQRGFYTVGGEVLLITAILCASMWLLEEKHSVKKPKREWLTIES